ncbi:hypothetical protein JAAARDRAFT_199213 [Jaapia argillacea MUCL 33604]|uniref:Cysteine protease n=1 Tax=Jaapia argillacea MUCL 33604 TaxID=933084 RepID=A0A067PLP8_9AGAM|nr:hypothetical protein JAAARDRAFT_199213 [Jaapia argillacea MUCL 33604]
MSAKGSRLSPSPSSPLPNHGSKLPKFLQKQNRDRSKSTSLTDPGGSGASSVASSSSSSSNQISDLAMPRRKGASRLLGRGDKSRQSPDSGSPALAEMDLGEESAMEEPPVIIEPPMRSRTRSERPLSSVSDIPPSSSLLPSSSGRLSELPTRLSGWFQHTFSTSSTDLSLPSLLAQSQFPSSGGASPRAKASALVNVAKTGKGHLDKAMRYLLDSDATPDRCPDPIWLLGVQHPGYEAPPPPTTPPPSTGPARRSSADSRRSPQPPSSLRSSTSSSTSQTVTVNNLGDLSQSLSASASKHPAANWPPVFYADFTSRIWLTYRSHFSPIRDSSLTALESELADSAALSGSPQPKRWNWPIGGEKGWTSDAGWGCMLRTGQSLLANALLHLQLGRDWRRPPTPVHTADYATYVQLITWFLDSPSPLCPFSVHRMALAGKELGKDVGQWFGPSTAAGAIKNLVHSFPEAGLGVAVAVDGVVYQTDVYAASHGLGDSPRGRGHYTWGYRAVLVLVGIRLGLDGVNPIYYDSIKTLYTWPQSVGIAGGRPSSSYYFVGSQADNLFYLDPHHARPAVPLRPPPTAGETVTPRAHSQDRWERQNTPDSISSDWEGDSRRRYKIRSPTHHSRSPTSPASSVRTGSSTWSNHPSPLQKQFSSSTGSSSSHSNSHGHSRWQSTIGPDTELDHRELMGEELDSVQEHYVNAYSAVELKTFHCDRVRKMPLSGLDPSMLIGFLCKDENDWIDLRQRINELSKNNKTIFSIQDEPPTWPSDSDEFMGLESISDPEMDMDMPEEEEEEYADARSLSISPDTSMQGGGKGSEADTEEDPIGPITPGPNSRTTFEIVDDKSRNTFGEDEATEPPNDLEDDDWVDPSIPTPIAEPSPPPVQDPSPPEEHHRKSKSKDSGERKHGKKSRKAPTHSSYPSEQQHYPFPVTVEDPEDSVVSARGTNSKRIPQMHSVKARDGGRTQSGGVKGAPTEGS